MAETKTIKAPYIDALNAFEDEQRKSTNNHSFLGIAVDHAEDFCSYDIYLGTGEPEEQKKHYAQLVFSLVNAMRENVVIYELVRTALTVENKRRADLKKATKTRK